MVAPTEPPVASLETQAPTANTITSLPTPVPSVIASTPLPSTTAPSESIATSSPTPQTTALRTDNPVTSAPTLAPSLVVTFSPSATPIEPCISTDGTFGVVSGTVETDVPISYMYEMETVSGVTPETIDSVILPQLEKAIVDSVLEEVFPDGCVGTEVGKRRLRLKRRLTVTGITMNPSDLINEECKKTEQQCIQQIVLHCFFHRS
jgi:hypothetical protein